jgi:cytochrome P450
MALRAMRRAPLEFFVRLARDHGDVARARLGGMDLILLSHPDLVREVLVGSARAFGPGRGIAELRRLLGDGLLTSDGELHRRQRRLLQPLFRPAAVAGYAQRMVELAAATAQRWTAATGRVVDVHAEMTELTLRVIAGTVFGLDLDPDDRRGIREALTGQVTFDRMFSPFADLLDRLPLPGTLRAHRARAELDAVVWRMIRRRRDDPGEGRDLLSLLLATRDDDDAPGQGGGHGVGMSARQVRDEALTILLAGHETTANALTWTWHLLAGQPHAEAALDAELDQVLAGRAPTAADIPALRWTRAVVSEAVRLYPPAWAVGRRALVDHEIGGYLVPARSSVVMSPYVVQRDPRFWPDPTGFRPQRWTDEAARERPRYAYFPFGGGARACIGEHFAWLEATLLLATLAQHWRPRALPGRRVEPEPLVTLRPLGGLPMILEPRPR